MTVNTSTIKINKYYKLDSIVIGGCTRVHTNIRVYWLWDSDGI